LFGMGRDPERLREKWLDLAWDAVRKTPADKRLPLLQSIGFVTNQFPDVATSLKVWDMLPEEVRSKEREQMITRAIFDYRSPEGSHADHLTAAGRWDDAAKFYLDVIARLAKMKGAPQPAFHAAAGACLRKAGRAAEAAAQEALVEKLALGNNALEIATAYASCDDQQHAVEWWARAARQSEPGTRYFSESLREHAQAMLDRGNWKEAAAICEVRAQFDSSVESPGSTPLFQLRTRLQADLAHALDLLKSDRERALAILANCHRMFPSDGSLADDFFPALRKMGLIEEHDEWFQISWERMIAVLERYPGSHNTCNTTAWLASRAQRNLDEAEKLELRALASLPNQSAYLDTMAELQFAKGKREKALEWSRKAVNFMPNDPILRRQQERFRTGPLPR
jgi:tetratricopeptide (TPR) repeat protein